MQGSVFVNQWVCLMYLKYVNVFKSFFSVGQRSETFSFVQSIQFKPKGENIVISCSAP